MTAPDDAVKAVTALQFNAPWDPWGLTPDEARTVIAAAMPHIRAQIAADQAARLGRAVARLEERQNDLSTRPNERIRLGGKVEGVKLAASYIAEITRGES